MRSSLLHNCLHQNTSKLKYFIVSFSSYTPLTDTTSIQKVFEEIKSVIRVPHIVFASNEPYATRTSTVVLVDHEGMVTFLERDWFDSTTLEELREEERVVGEVGWRFRIGEEARLAERVVRVNVEV